MIQQQLQPLPHRLQCQLILPVLIVSRWASPCEFPCCLVVSLCCVPDITAARTILAELMEATNRYGSLTIPPVPSSRVADACCYTDHVDACSHGHVLSTNFTDLPDPVEEPLYYTVIDQPLDLNTISVRSTVTSHADLPTLTWPHLVVSVGRSSLLYARCFQGRHRAGGKKRHAFQRRWL
jgi:hypothetical protein